MKALKKVIEAEKSFNHNQILLLRVYYVPNFGILIIYFLSTGLMFDIFPILNISYHVIRCGDIIKTHFRSWRSPQPFELLSHVSQSPF